MTHVIALTLCLVAAEPAQPPDADGERIVISEHPELRRLQELDSFQTSLGQLRERVVYRGGGVPRIVLPGPTETNLEKGPLSVTEYEHALRALVREYGLTLASRPRSRIGFVSDARFIVFAPDEATAEAVLAQANIYWAEASKTYFGRVLPPKRRTLINVHIGRPDDGTLWLANPQDPRQMHNIWLYVGSREEAVGEPLRDAVRAVVYATGCPEQSGVFIIRK